ncbi:uncharacterized protein [Littorina saxatilis]|uniref:Fucosyltransferase n=1 Tax=Littorina saxatilis TaxID=31220 RepID=A0AAN9G4Z4_9CAEN
MKSLYVRAAKTGLLLALLVSLVTMFSDMFSSLTSAEKSNSASLRFLHRRLPETDNHHTGLSTSNDKSADARAKDGDGVRSTSQKNHARRRSSSLVGTGSLNKTGSLEQTESLDKALSFTRALLETSIENELSNVNAIRKHKAQVHGRRFSGDDKSPHPFENNKSSNSESDDDNDVSKNSTNTNNNNSINNNAKHNASKAPKTLIYHCPIEVKCGGLADRLKGCVLGYLLAYVTGRQFRILMPLPGCKLSDMLEENSISWRMTKEDDPKFLDDENKRLIYTRMNANSRFHDELTAVNYREYFGGADVVYFRTNVERFKWLFSNPHHAKDLQPFYSPHNSVIYRNILNQLFNLAPPLQAQVNAALNKGRTSDNTGRPPLLVCAQIRTGRNPSMPKDSTIRVTSLLLPKIWDFMKKEASGFSKQSAVSFFVSSDSEQILEEARKVFGKDLLQVGGRIVHVDQPLAQDDVCPGMRRVLVDMHVLTSCHVLLLTRSGVGDLAADLRGTEQGLYCLNLHTLRIEKCRP